MSSPSSPPRPRRSRSPTPGPSGSSGRAWRRPGRTRSAIIEFLTPDVDADCARLRAAVEVWVTEPAVMPWGNRSALLRDPDGNLVNLFTPVTPEAVEKFARFTR
ncbi:VOC family protein [Microbacterium sp. BWR-S6Y]|uniref:VOC family protein n=1 Tax=Microbacterium sp. BWR-S6Y TaxID=3232073 RepID=UPI003528688E